MPDEMRPDLTGELARADEAASGGIEARSALLDPLVDADDDTDPADLDLSVEIDEDDDDAVEDPDAGIDPDV